MKVTINKQTSPLTFADLDTDEAFIILGNLKVVYIKTDDMWYGDKLSEYINVIILGNVNKHVARIRCETPILRVTITEVIVDEIEESWQ